ncbi:hypothetical protein [Krasilnikovia sp. MM14-A1004]|uniref:hypothetical protein n=1 Tax=Krasilnikovia sp. MM14-A1004 TaxID=3373541 RepID=UPI00399D34FE
MGQDVPLELRGLQLRRDLRAFLGGRHVADLQLRDRGVDTGQLLVIAVRLLPLRHGTSSTDRRRVPEMSARAPPVARPY